MYPQWSHCGCQLPPVPPDLRTMQGSNADAPTSEIGSVFQFGTPLRPGDASFSPLRPGGHGGDHLSSPFTFMNQLSPLVKMHGGGFNPDLMSPGLTPLLGRNNLTDSLTMPIPTLMSAENFGIMSPTGTPGRGYGYYRLNSIRKIEFNEGDEAIDALVARYQEPPSLTVPESASGDERPVGRRVSFDLSEHANARGVRDTAGAEDIGLPSLVRPPTLPLINKRSHVEFAVDVAAAPPSGPVPPAEEEPARAILVKTEKTAAPAKPARRKAPMSSRTRAGKSDGDGITSPAPQTTTRAYSTPSNRNTQPLGETTPSQAVPIKKITPCNCKKSKCLKLYCECFASNRVCGSACNCVGCINTSVDDPVRQCAVQTTLDRNPNAFAPRLVTLEAEVHEVVVQTATKGCHCKKSGCLKKYCECFQAGLVCGSSCKCLDCQNMDGSDRLVEIRRSSTKKPSTRPSGPAVTGGSDGSPGHKHHTGDGEEASSGLLLLSDEPGPDEIILNENGRPSRASGRASKRALAHIAHQLLEDEDEDEEDDDVFEEDEGEGRLLPPKLPLKGRKDAPPGASPAVIVRAGGNGKQAPSKKAKAAPLRKPMLSLPPALSPNTAIPPPPSHQSSTSELAQESPMLPKRRWQATVCWPRHHPRHMTFGWRNPAVPDPLITNILSYLANDDVHNSSLVCNAWAALAMDCFLWDWDGVVGVTTLVPVVDPVSAAGGNQFESMFPLTPQRPGKGGYPGLPFMCDELPTGSSYLGSPLVSPTGGRYFGMLSSTPDRSVRLSHMSPLLCPSPERPLNPPANSGNVRRPEAPRR